MDLQHLKQWQKHQQKHESDQQSDSTRLLLNDCYYQQNHSNCSELPLFTSPEQSSTELNLHLAPPASCRSYFSMAQWQELEVQACIYRHFIAGAPVPPQVLHLVKKRLILNSRASSPYYHSSPYQSALSQSGGYWGRGGMDPEPGRCRRTDGKKWLCSRDVVGGYKYCERHMHRGRNRSRKPVETPTHSNAAFLLAANEDTNQSVVAQPPTATPFRLSGPSHSFDLLPVNRRFLVSLVFFFIFMLSLFPLFYVVLVSLKMLQIHQCGSALPCPLAHVDKHLFGEFIIMNYTHYVSN